MAYALLVLVSSSVLTGWTRAEARAETRTGARTGADVDAALVATARAVSDPADPAFGAFLSPAQAGAAFGPSVRTSLRATPVAGTGGMRPAAPAPYLTPGPCGTAFGTSPAAERPPAYGRTLSWPVCGYTPAQLRSAYGVDRTGLTGRGATIAVVGAYAAPRMAETVAAYSAARGEPAFRAGQYREVLPEGGWTHTDDGSCDPQSIWWTEQALDVEALHAIAPGADIVYVAARSCTDADLAEALGKVVSGRLADLVSASWSTPSDRLPAATVAAYQRIFLLGAVEGIGFYFSSGNCGPLAPSLDCAARVSSARAQVEYPASDPWVTAVGGTTLAVGSSGEYLWETGWGTSSAALSADGTSWLGPPGTFVRGSGGGVSTRFAQPFYQALAVPATLSRKATGSRMRTVPDLAVDADPETGMLVGLTLILPDGSPFYFESRHGGTSLAAPLVAGLHALVQERRDDRPLGFANPSLYLRAGLLTDVTDTPRGVPVPPAVAHNEWSNPADPFSPVVTSMRTMAVDGQGDAVLDAGPGYDPVTGLGSPNRAYLLSYR